MQVVWAAILDVMELSSPSDPGSKLRGTAYRSLLQDKSINVSNSSLCSSSVMLILQTNSVLQLKSLI